MFTFNPLGNFLTNATRPRRALGESDLVNPDNIDFTSAMQPPTPVQQQGGHPLLGAIINALASGVGVGLSQDPGQALMSQLAQQRQMQMEQAKMAEDRRRQQIQFEQQKTLEGIQQQGRMQIQGSQQQFQREEGASADALKKEMQQAGFNNEKEMQATQIKAHEQLTQMQQDFEMNKMWDNQDFAKELETLKNTGDIKQAQSKTLMASLFHAMQNSRYVKGAPIPPSAVINITDKVGKGEPLTKEDTDVIDRAFKASAAANAAAMRAAGSGRGGGGKEDRKDIQMQRQDQLDWEKGRRDIVQQTMNNFRVPLTDANGQQVKDINGNVQMVQGSGPELTKRINEVLSVHDAVNPQPYSRSTGHPNPKGLGGGANEIRNLDALNAQVDQIAPNHSLQELNNIIDLDPNLNTAEKRQAKARASLKKQSGNWNKYIGQ